MWRNFAALKSRDMPHAPLSPSPIHPNFRRPLPIATPGGPPRSSPHPLSLRHCGPTHGRTGRYILGVGQRQLISNLAKFLVWYQRTLHYIVDSFKIALPDSPHIFGKKNRFRAFHLAGRNGFSGAASVCIQSIH